MATITLDPEISAFIQAIKPTLEKTADPGIIDKIICGMDPDQAIELFVEDRLDSWLQDQIKSVVKKPHNTENIDFTPIIGKSRGVMKHDPPTDPAPIPAKEIKPEEPATIEDVRRYITKRYPRLLDYAKYHSELAKWSEEGVDVLHEAILSTLLLPEEKLLSLFNKKKRDQNLTELDFYLLRIIKLSCHSVNSPYYWRYHKGAVRDDNAETEKMNNSGGFDDQDNHYKYFEPEIIADVEEDTEVEQDYYEPEQDNEPQDFEELICVRFRILRDVLEKLPVPERDKDIFRHKFMLEESWTTWKGKEGIKLLQTTFKRMKSMVIDEIQKLKDEHILKSIHELFLQAKSLKLPILEAEFLLLRKWLTEQKENSDPEQLKVITAFEKRLLFVFSEQLENFNINHKF